ncbi:hypothetical protein [Paenibacillus glycanilyticus]
MKILIQETNRKEQSIDQPERRKEQSTEITVAPNRKEQSIE